MWLKKTFDSVNAEILVHIELIHCKVVFYETVVLFPLRQYTHTRIIP